MSLATLWFVLALILPQTPPAPQHSASLSWQAPPDATASTTYSVYRAGAACPVSGLGGLTFTKVVSGLTTTAYLDSTIVAGQWCYYVTQVTNGVESDPGTTGGGTAKPNTVTFTVVIK